MAELSAFRQNLLYYRERAKDLKGRVPTDRYCEDMSFCGCLEAVTGEGGEKLRRMSASAKAAGYLATSAAETAAVRYVPASRNRAGA